MPRAGVWVVVHEVRADGAGPADSARTDFLGRYRVRVGRAAPNAVYQVSATYLGIAYFSEAQPPQAGRVAFPPLLIYDTASTGLPLRLAHRLVTVARSEDDGTRPVIELLEIENPDRAIRVASDTTRPVWTGSLPGAAIQFQVGVGDVSPDAVLRRDDRVELYAPIAPGGPKQVTYRYTLAADVRRLELPIDSGTGRLSLLLEDTTAQVTGGDTLINDFGVTDLEQRRFAVYVGDSFPRGATLAIALPASRRGPPQLIPVIVVLAAAALAGGLIVALRRKPRKGGRGTGAA